MPKILKKQVRRRPRQPRAKPEFNVHLHHHFPEGHPDQVLQGIHRLERQMEQIMASNAQFAEALARVDVATTRIGADIQTLLARIQAGGLSEAEEAQVLTDIGTRAAALEAIADSVENPVPPLPPEVTP